MKTQTAHIAISVIGILLVSQAYGLSVTPAQASSFACNSLLSQAEINIAAIKSTLNNFEANTAMMNASTSAGDTNSAQFYASANKDLAIRLVGLYTESRGILTSADNEPNNCGMSDANIKIYLQTIREDEESFKNVLKMFKKN